LMLGPPLAVLGMCVLIGLLVVFLWGRR